MKRKFTSRPAARSCPINPDFERCDHDFGWGDGLICGGNSAEHSPELPRKPATFGRLARRVRNDHL